MSHTNTYSVLNVVCAQKHVVAVRNFLQGINLNVVKLRKVLGHVFFFLIVTVLSRSTGKTL